MILSDMAFLISTFRTHVVIVSRPTGGYLNGIWVGGVPTPIANVSIFFDPKQRDSDIVKDQVGEYAEKEYIVWSDTVLQDRDYFTVSGKIYEVRSMDSFADVGFYRATCALKAS